MSFYNYLTLASVTLLILLILVQTRGADLGAGMGGGGEVNTVRRGSDRTLHQITIIIAFIFASSLILNLVG